MKFSDVSCDVTFSVKAAFSATPLFLFTSGDTIIKLLEIKRARTHARIRTHARAHTHTHTHTHTITKTWVEQRLRILLKIYALSMDDKLLGALQVMGEMDQRYIGSLHRGLVTL